MSDYELVKAWVAPSNVEQLAAWDGDAGGYWAARADRFDEGVTGYRHQFLAAATINATAKVLDVGCGSGQATRDAARCATAGSTLGVDLSSRMIELARQRAADSEQVANVTFDQADAQVQPFPDHSFTIVISRHGAMFFRDAPTAFTNIARAMSPGGRLILPDLATVRAQRMAERLLHDSGRRSRPGHADAWPVPPEQFRPGATTAELGWVPGRPDAGAQRAHVFGPDPDDAFRFISGQHAAMVRATSTPTPEAEPSTTCEPAWRITRPNEACTTTQQRGSPRRRS